MGKGYAQMEGKSHRKLALAMLLLFLLVQSIGMEQLMIVNLLTFLFLVQLLKVWEITELNGLNLLIRQIMTN